MKPLPVGGHFAYFSNHCLGKLYRIGDGHAPVILMFNVLTRHT